MYSATQTIQALKADTEVVKQHPKVEEVFNPLTIDGVTYTDKKQAGEALIERCKKLTSVDAVHIGEYRGFQLYAKIYSLTKAIIIDMKNELSYSIDVGADVFGNIQRLDNALARIEPRIEENELALEETKKQFEVAKVESQKEFPQEAELKEKLERLATLDTYTKDGILRTKVYYCDAGCPHQKGSIEVNHELIRRVLPKGVTFDNLTQEKIDIMMNHINSYSRLKLGNKTPFEAFEFYYGSELFEKLGYKQVEKNQVIINPKLLKR